MASPSTTHVNRCPGASRATLAAGERRRRPRRFFLLGLAIILTIFAVGVAVQGPTVQATAQPTAQPPMMSAASLRPVGGPDGSQPLAAPRHQSAGEELCGPGLTYLPEIDSCTHGPDPAPSGLDEDRPVGTLTVRAASARTASLACDSDGQTGPRVQVLYVRGAQMPSPGATLLNTVRGWAAEADQIFQNSAAATGGSRHIRFVHDAACDPVVIDAAVSANALANFTTMINELRGQGHTRHDRIYLTFVDSTSAGICGIATIRNDDQPSETLNQNNIGRSFARIDRGCWSGRVAAHELMHNLGGVQNTAPNTSNGFHCTDQHDVMCYSDYPDYPSMRTICPDPSYRLRLDCGHDDYFHTAPPASNYLATHWNPANSRFLIRGPDDPTGSIPIPPGVADTTPPRVTVAVPKTPRGGQRLTIHADAADNGGVGTVAFGVCRGKRCTWEAAHKLGIDRARPYRVSWKAPKRGTFTIIARATDAAGNSKVVKKIVTIRPVKQRSRR